MFDVPSLTGWAISLARMIFTSHCLNVSQSPTLAAKLGGLVAFFLEPPFLGCFPLLSLPRVSVFGSDFQELSVELFGARPKLVRFGLVPGHL